MIPFLSGDLQFDQRITREVLKDEIPISSSKLLEIKVEDLKMHKGANR